jgi:hypothetical protein
MTDRPDLSYPIPEDRLPTAVFAITCAALGYPRGTTPPPPVAAFATAMRSAVEAQLAAPASGSGDAPGEPLRKASAGAVFAAVAYLARLGLLPGALGTGTGYLYAQSRALTGRPTPVGRVRMAFAAGADVETAPVGPTCILEMGQDGLVATLRRDPDNVPRKWEDLRGVVVSVTSHASGACKMHWVSAGEIDDRRQRAQGKGEKGAWKTDPVAMARAKALSIIGDRGGFPQAPIPIPGLREWQAAQAAAPSAPALPAPLASPVSPVRALPAPAEAAPDAPQPPLAAPQAPQDAPPPEADPRPADDAPARPEAPVQTEAPAEPAPAAEPTWDDVGYAVWEALRSAALGAGLSAGSDDLHAAVSGAVVGARAGAEARGRPLTPAAALAPGAQARLVELALERLRAM